MPTATCTTRRISIADSLDGLESALAFFTDNDPQVTVSVADNGFYVTRVSDELPKVKLHSIHTSGLLQIATDLSGRLERLSPAERRRMNPSTPQENSPYHSLSGFRMETYFQDNTPTAAALIIPEWI